MITLSRFIRKADDPEKAVATIAIDDINGMTALWASRAVREAERELVKEIVAFVMRERRDEILSALTADAVVDATKDAIGKAVANMFTEAKR